jgi:bacteriocin-like protein
MSNENNRVLIRRGARSLTENEMAEVSGGANTLASSLATGPISNPDDILDQ